MVAKKTLQRYIESLDKIIESNDSPAAEKIQKEIIVSLESELDGLKRGLTNYGPIALYSNGRTGKTVRVGETVDFLKDAELLRARLQAEIEKYYEKEDDGLMSNRSYVFISHRSIDVKIAEMIKDFLVNTGIPNEKIFCSSLPGNDVQLRISEEVKQRLKESVINILILTKDYYDSAYCMNEAGVIWYLQDEVTALAIGLPEINCNNMLGFFGNDNKIRRLNNENDIAAMYDMVQKKLNVKVPGISIITIEKQKLFEKYTAYILERKIEQNVDQTNQPLEFDDSENTILIFFL